MVFFGLFMCLCLKVQREAAWVMSARMRTRGLFAPLVWCCGVMFFYFPHLSLVCVSARMRTRGVLLILLCYT